jgi:hypothetical protein
MSVHASSPQPPSASAATSAGEIFRAWTGRATLGEFVGFSVPAVVAALTPATPVGLTVLLLIAAGFVEGAVLGFAQARVLHRILPALQPRRWVVATAAGASVAWAIGLLPMLTDGRLFDVPPTILVPVATVLGILLLGSIGTAQWLVLRSHVERSRWWIAATAAAWIGGLVVFTAVTTPLWQPGQAPVLTAATGVLGGLLMAATVATLTGWAVVRLSRECTRKLPAPPRADDQRR